MEFVCLFVCLLDCLFVRVCLFVFAFPVPTHVGDQTPVKQTRRKEVRRGRGVITFIPARLELWDMDTRIICWHNCTPMLSSIMIMIMIIIIIIITILIIIIM